VARSGQARCPRRQRRNDSIESIMRAPDRLFIRPAVQPWGCRQEIIRDGGECIRRPGLLIAAVAQAPSQK